MLLVGAGLVVLALLVAFAIALSDTQAGSKAAIEARVHDRAVLAAALVDSIFTSVTQQAPADNKTFGGAHVSAATLAAKVNGAEYLALLDARGETIASTPGFNAQARAELSQGGAAKLVAAGSPLAVGNLRPYGHTGVVNLALGLDTAHGRRVIVEGVSPATLSALLTPELRRIPGVKGSTNLILDAHDTVIASNVPSRPTGYHYANPSIRALLDQPTGDRHGYYFDEVGLSDSNWRLVLGAPDSRLFASISGLHRWIPWVIFIAFAIFAILSLGLGWRLLHSAEQDLATVNAELEQVNRELERSNHELARRAKELARSNAELDQFASIASHDLQEPLRKVRTFTEQLTVTESEHLSERGVEYLRRANRAAERMQRLIQDLLQYSRVTSSPRPYVKVDLGEVVADALDDLSVEVESVGARVTVGELPVISADPLQMRQLFLNLLSNALKFRREEVTPTVSVTASADERSARIVVADNGIGFEPRYASRIFRVFERLNGRGEYPGTGIGLALCQKIVMRHGGEILAEGELGLGARFTVTLPLEHEDTPDPESTSDATPASEAAPSTDAASASKAPHAPGATSTPDTATSTSHATGGSERSGAAADTATQDHPGNQATSGEEQAHVPT